MRISTKNDRVFYMTSVEFNKFHKGDGHAHLVTLSTNDNNPLSSMQNHTEIQILLSERSLKFLANIYKDANEKPGEEDGNSTKESEEGKGSN